MTYQEKKSIVSLISSILIFAAYCLYRYPQYPEGGLDSKEVFHYWGSFVLVLMVVSIAAHSLVESGRMIKNGELFYTAVSILEGVI